MIWWPSNLPRDHFRVELATGMPNAVRSDPRLRNIKQAIARTKQASNKAMTMHYHDRDGQSVGDSKDRKVNDDKNDHI